MRNDRQFADAMKLLGCVAAVGLAVALACAFALGAMLF